MQLHLRHVLVLRGLQAIGVDNHEPYVQQAAEWLRSVQNPDGGWGETLGSYDNPACGAGREYGFANGLGVLGLLAAGDTRSDCVERGIMFLLRTSVKTVRGGRRRNRYGIPQSFLPEISHVRRVLPVARASDLFAGDEKPATSRQDGEFRFGCSSRPLRKALISGWT